MNQKIKNKNIYKIKFVIILFFALFQIGQARIAFSVSITSEEMIELTNASRTEAGLPILSINEKLSLAAQKKASDMFEFQYFEHNSPSGKTPWEFIKSTGYEYRYAGENLAIDFISAKGTHKALMQSLSHRENILNEKYTEIGIAVIEGMFEGSRSIIIVEEFGNPLEKVESKKISQVKSVNQTQFVVEKKIDEVQYIQKSEQALIENDILKEKESLNENEDVDELKDGGACYLNSQETKLFFYFKGNEFIRRINKVENKELKNKLPSLVLIKTAYAKKYESLENGNENTMLEFLKDEFLRIIFLNSIFIFSQ